LGLHLLPRRDHLTHRLAGVLPGDLLRVGGDQGLDRLDELGAATGRGLSALGPLRLERPDLLLGLLAQLGGACAQRRDVADDLRLLHVLAQVLQEPVELVLGVLGRGEGGGGLVEEGDQVQVPLREGLERGVVVGLGRGADRAHLGAVLDGDGAVLRHAAEGLRRGDLGGVVLGGRGSDGQQRRRRLLPRRRGGGGGGRGRAGTGRRGLRHGSRCRRRRRRRGGGARSRGGGRVVGGSRVVRGGRGLRGSRSLRGGRVGRGGLPGRGALLGRGAPLGLDAVLGRCGRLAVLGGGDGTGLLGGGRLLRGRQFRGRLLGGRGLRLGGGGLRGGLLGRGVDDGVGGLGGCLVGGEGSLGLAHD